MIIHITCLMCKNILTAEEEEKFCKDGKRFCNKCRAKKHADEFHELYDIKKEALDDKVNSNS